MRLPAWTKRFHLGIDENGMGPRLGPLVVTSVLVDADPADERRPRMSRGARLVTSRPAGALSRRIGDSKRLASFEDSRLGEAWARAIAARTSSRGAIARTPDALLASLFLDEKAVLQAPCPGHHVDLCWGTDGEAFAADDDAVAACQRDLDRLETRGVRVVRARVAIACARRLNDALRRGLSRFDVDLHTMERLTLAGCADAGEEVYAICGKVGGFDFYADRFGPLAGRLHTTLVEGRARSEYAMPGIGRLAFVRDADDTHLIVALASLVGKWARDHLMRRVVRYHRVHQPDLPDASGYHDPVTARFIRASAIVRRDRRIDEACFERDALYKLQAREGRPA